MLLPTSIYLFTTRHPAHAERQIYILMEVSASAERGRKCEAADRAEAGLAQITQRARDVWLARDTDYSKVKILFNCVSRVNPENLDRYKTCLIELVQIALR